METRAGAFRSSWLPPGAQIAQAHCRLPNETELENLSFSVSPPKVRRAEGALAIPLSMPVNRKPELICKTNKHLSIDCFIKFSGKECV